MKYLLISLSAWLALMAGGNALAQGRWRDMPPEDRRQMREQMREQWHQRESQREYEMARWRDLPPEDRRQMREQMREQPSWREGARETWGNRGWRRD